VHDSFLTGLAVVFAAGILQGSFLFPSKWIKNWAWENYWLIFASVAYLVSPWLLALATVPRLSEVYSGVDAGTLAVIFAFGLAWGVGALTFGLGVDAVGLSLGFAVILGVAASAGAIIPLLVHPPMQLSAMHLGLTGAAIVVMLTGVAVCSYAGRWKETPAKDSKKSYAAGIAICMASGVLSACGNLGFVFGANVAARAQSLGAPQDTAGNAVWTLLAMPLFLCNAGYSMGLLLRNRTLRCYTAPFSRRNFGFGLMMGAMWMAGMSLYGAGARRMGTLGLSLGWAILMSSMVLVANVLGVAAGEWSGAPPRSRRQLWMGLGWLLVAIALLGYTNYAAAGSGVVK